MTTIIDISKDKSSEIDVGMSDIKKMSLILDNLRIVLSFEQAVELFGSMSQWCIEDDDDEDDKIKCTNCGTMHSIRNGVCQHCLHGD